MCVLYLYNSRHRWRAGGVGVCSCEQRGDGALSSYVIDATHHSPRGARHCSARADAVEHTKARGVGRNERQDTQRLLIERRLDGQLPRALLLLST